ncbi:MAG: FMN-binding protein [Christensenellales bacterium]
MKSKRGRLRKFLLILLCLLVVGGGVAYLRLDASLKALKSLPLKAIDLSGIPDGSYGGQYSAFPVSAKVSVSVLDHVISDIKLLEHNHGQGAGAETIPGQVVAAQSLQVDTVSGATYSSVVILKAIENALLAAEK